MSLLEVASFTLSFTQYEAGLRRVRLRVLDGMDLEVDTGELVAVVGASGSGKSLLAHAICGVLPANATEGGVIRYDGRELTQARRERLRGEEIALVPQSVGFLDPLARAGQQTRRAADLAGVADPATAAAEAYRRLELPAQVAGRFPHELSGGMARRVLAATATIGSPRLVLADEPTPGLHQSLAAETLRGLRKLADNGAAVVVITHDLRAATEIADRIAVFNAGRTVEVAAPAAFSGAGDGLAQPYSRALLDALPGNGFGVDDLAAVPAAAAPGATAPTQPGGDAGLTASGLRFRHPGGDDWLIDGVDLTVRPGEVVGLRGPSGRGKTTLAKLLAGYLEPAAGTVHVDGRALPRRGMAPVQLVFQHPELAIDPRWRMHEVLEEAGEVDMDTLRELHIRPEWLLRHPNELSGGELQRFAVARALATGAGYVVADEVSAMLDAITQARIWRVLLRRVRSGGLGLLAISHDGDLLARVADRVVDLGAPATEPAAT